MLRASAARKFIRRLAQQYATVLVLSDLEGYRDKEIAEILGIGLETVKVRLHRARAQFKLELSQGCTISYDRDDRLVCEWRDPRAASTEHDPPKQKP